MRYGRGSAEGEAIRLDVRVEKLDLEEAVGNRSGLADQLIGALVAHHPAAVRIHVAPALVFRELTIEEHPEPDRRATGRRAHHEVEIARVELEGDSSAMLVQDRGVPGDRPVPRESPLIEAQPSRQRVDARLVEARDTFLGEAGALVVADIRLRRLQR